MIYVKRLGLWIKFVRLIHFVEQISCKKLSMKTDRRAEERRHFKTFSSSQSTKEERRVKDQEVLNNQNKSRVSMIAEYKGIT